VLAGHIGLSNVNGKSASLDNVMKYQLERGKSRIDVMGISLRGLLAWAVSNLGINLFELVVRSDNLRAIELYDRLGFDLVETLYLRVTHTGSHAEYVNSSVEESNTSVRKLVFQKRYPTSPIYARPQGLS
jgi:RimJ/RimL family protein N-acetyltransferase